MKFGIAICAGLIQMGCSARHVTTPTNTAPADFALSITLIGANPEPALQPAWYVLDPDGTLHAAMGDRTVSSPLPPIVRQLGRAEVETVWQRVADSGLAQALESRTHVPEWKLPEPGTSLVFLGASGERRTVILDTPREQVAGVVKVLRELAWIDRQ